MQLSRATRRRLIAAGASCLLWPALAHAAAADGGGGNALTRFEPGLLIWTIVTFLALLLLLRWKAWPVIVKALRAREEATRTAIAAAREEREKAEKLLEEHRALIAQARRDTAALLDQGRRDAEQVRTEILDKARREQHDVIEQGRRQITQETRAAVAELKTHAVDLALAASEKLMRRSLDGDAQRRLIEETLSEMAELEGGKRPDAS